MRYTARISGAASRSCFAFFSFSSVARIIIIVTAASTPSPARSLRHHDGGGSRHDGHLKAESAKLGLLFRNLRSDGPKTGSINLPNRRCPIKNKKKGKPNLCVCVRGSLRKRKRGRETHGSGFKTCENREGEKAQERQEVMGRPGGEAAERHAGFRS